MRIALARAMMALASRCLGECRREWARAMQAEFEAAIDDRRPLAFAAGCLIAAWRQMPTQKQGRLALANYGVALGLLVPMAGLQLTCAVAFPRSLLGQGTFNALLAPGPYLADAYPSAIPALLVLWLMLGLGHLRLAWFLLERDWSRVMSAAALTVATLATLVVFTGVLFLNDASVALQAILLAIELSAIYASAQWHDRLFPPLSA